MLEKLDSVKKVGLFDDYAHSPECALTETSIIYGENGVGKSTIAAILDSLREGSAGEIIRRRSLPGTTPPTVSATLSGKTYTFDGTAWTERAPDNTLEVFFSGFVSRNVHAANSVETEHRRSLCELVLGRGAVKNVARLTAVDEESRQVLTEKRLLESQLTLLIKKPDTLEIFLGLAKLDDIEGQLDKVRAELKQAQSMAAILAKPLPTPVTLPEVDSETIYKPFDQRSDAIGADVASVIQNHIKTHLDSDGATWLGYGAQNIRENKCPFCAQDLTGSEVSKAIRSYFSAEYRTYIDALSAEIKILRERFGSAVFSQLRAAFLNQVAIAAQWNEELPIDKAGIDGILAEAEVAWKSASAQLGELVRNKQAQPLVRTERANVDKALSEYNSAVGTLSKANDILSASRKKAEERKAALSKSTTTEIEGRLNRLENHKARHSPMAEDLLTKRTAAIEKRTKLDAEKDTLKKDIDEHAGRVVGKYQDGINHYLTHFGCDIRIESVEPKFPGGKASVHYKLKAHGHEIQLGLSVAEPSFETVLSEGDKYTLALSFFFARVKHLDSLAGYIIVLDDPVNSLGNSRRTLIEDVIRDLRKRGAQVIVLTHDTRLAALIWRDKALNKLGRITSLQVERVGKGSKLMPWDVEKATQEQYVHDYLALTDFLANGGEHKLAAKSIRPYLEQRLRHLYPGPPFTTRDTLGVMIGTIRKYAADPRFKTLASKLAELESINNSSLPEHHAADDVPSGAPLTAEGVRIFARKALDILG